MGYSGVRLMAAGLACPFIFVEDPGRCVQSSFQPICPMEHGRSPCAVNGLHFLGDFDPPLFAKLLLIDGVGEEGGEARACP